MSTKYLGVPFDIHGGGQDLIFPHHENEIAQTEAAYGNGFANYWMHVGLLKIKGEKMSKSIGNIISIREAIKMYNPEVIRFFFASMHYRSPPNFTEEAMENAKRSLEKIYRVYDLLGYYEKREDGEEDEEIERFVEELKMKFEKAMDDDFNTPLAMKSIFEFIDKVNNKLRNKNLGPKSCKVAREALLKFCNILTLLQDVKDEIIDIDKIKGLFEKYGIDKDVKSGEEGVEILLKRREEARKKKDWELADSIRDDLKKLGIEVEDTRRGAVWYKKRVL